MTKLRHLLLLGAIFISAGSLAWTQTFADDATPAAPPAAAQTPAPAQTPAQTPAPTQTPAPGQQAGQPEPTGPVDVAELMKPGPLPEIAMGDEKAPVTIVEYHSMTCPHCSHFEETVFPTLDQKYIKTGKVRYVIRSFPLNQLDAVAFMLLRCRPTDTYFNNVKLMYDTQETWAYTDKPKEAITALAMKIGFTQESFEACLKDQTIWDGLMAIAKKGEETFKVDGTPTFFVNGTRAGAISTVDELDKALAPFIKN